jgi:hypothetical protein
MHGHMGDLRVQVVDELFETESLGKQQDLHTHTIECSLSAAADRDHTRLQKMGDWMERRAGLGKSEGKREAGKKVRVDLKSTES